MCFVNKNSSKLSCGIPHFYRDDQKNGCVYAKVANDLQAHVINYMDMFESCKCKPDTVANDFSSIT